MAKIPFTQFMLPDGRPVELTIERPDAIVEKAQQIIDAGYRFEVEMLGDSSVSLTIADDEMDHAIETCPNGPDVPHAVDRLVMGFSVPVAA